MSRLTGIRTRVAEASGHRSLRELAARVGVVEDAVRENRALEELLAQDLSMLEQRVFDLVEKSASRRGASREHRLS